MKYISLCLSLVIVTAVQVQSVYAYIDPGTAGSVVGGLGAGIGLVFAFFGSLAVATLMKIKKLWNWNVFGKLIIILVVLVLIGIVWICISFFI